MPPLLFFGIMIGITGVLWLVYLLRRRSRSKALHKLASQWHMQFSQADLFNLAARIATDFPLPGAADLRVRDLIYATDADRHRYLFTAEYTCGVIEPQRREQRAATFCEPKDCPHLTSASPLLLAPQELPITRQY